MTKRAGKKKRRAHVTVVPVETTTEKGPASGPTETGHDAPVVPRSGSLPAALPSPDEMQSVFWPELDPTNHAALNDKDERDGALLPAVREERRADREATYKRLWEWRTEIQAVKSHYNIPQGLRDRMVYEAAKAMTNTKLPTRERLAALNLLKAMDAANRDPGNLPPQIQVNTTTNIVAAPAAADGPKLSPQAIVAAMLERSDVLDAIDVYEFKDSEEDYAS